VTGRGHRALQAAEPVVVSMLIASRCQFAGVTPHEHQGRGRCWYTVRTQLDA